MGWVSVALMRGFVARLRRYEWRQHVLTAEGGTSGRTRQVQMQAPVFMRVQAALLLSEIVAICSTEFNHRTLSVSN